LLESEKGVGDARETKMPTVKKKSGEEKMVPPA